MSDRFPLAALDQDLEPERRADLVGELRQLLEWQRDLERWPRLSAAPDATPIVSLYVRGDLRGCAGVASGSPAERVQRAFLYALSDARFGRLDAEERAELVLQVSYARSPLPLNVDAAPDELEIGTHGLSLVRADGQAFTLLPDVARDHRLDAQSFLAALERKADCSRSAWPAHGLYSFRSERVIARFAPVTEFPSDARTAAARWLAARVAADGSVSFGLDPRSGEASAEGLLFDGRVAILVKALARSGQASEAANRARRWLERRLEAALEKRPPSAFPAEPPLVFATFALATLAGIDFKNALRGCPEHELTAAPWHAAQVAAALGNEAPASLWAACVRDLERAPWAPWTAIAAHARGDAEVFARAIRQLTESIRARAPYLGAVIAPETLPEIARTAATVEALSLADSKPAREACARAREFLRKGQLRASNYALAEDPAWVDGAFPISPIHDFLQIDVTAHAALALASGD